ncbi:hypothetical protein B0H19DRAFT_1250133 [Mycena capillaripes]|nr:hypothetical protein B0H19DRAFT_1250133 [Mycena capillaripes]
MSLVQTLEPVDTPRSSNDFSESSSQRTFTDTSTVWGPGTVSGRAILALGEATIRGIDALLIWRRLATIRLRSPSLTQAMCNDLVELCRPDMYSVRIAKEALRLTLMQIFAGPESSMYMFVVALCKWPREEARLIILELVRFGSLREVARPEWGLKRLYDFFLAIIQVKEGWRSLVVEAAGLLHNRFPPITTPTPILHPIHSIFIEAAQDLPESSLSSLQDMYSAGMRSEIWIALQACGLLLRDRLLKTEKNIQEADNWSAASIVDAFADIAIFLRSPHFDLGIKTSALNCVQSITATQWQSFYNFFGMHCRTIDSLRALIYLRTKALDSSDDMAEILFTFCLRDTPGIPPSLANKAALMIFENICSDSISERIHYALIISKLSGIQIQKALKTLLSNIPSFPIHQTLQPPTFYKYLCDLLVVVFQITGKCCLSSDVAAALSASAFGIRHPVLTISSEIVKQKAISPLSKLQAEMSEGSWGDAETARFDIWTALQTRGLRLQLRMAQIEHILGQKVSDHQTFDAVADASLFTRNAFSPELRSAAFECLLQHGLTSTSGILYDSLKYYTSFHRELEFRFLHEQLPMYA